MNGPGVMERECVVSRCRCDVEVGGSEGKV